MCSRDGGAFQTCSDSDFSVTTYRSLPQGEHTFQIQATDWAGNIQNTFFLSRPVNYSVAFEVNSTATSLQWRVDTTPPPKPQFVQRPPFQTNNRNPRFQFSLAGTQIGGISYHCGLSKPFQDYINFPCFPITDVATPASPVPGALNNMLEKGPHTLRVNAIDAAGNHGPYNYYDFTLDLEAPTVFFAPPPNGQVPAGPINNAPTMTFNFYSVDKFPEKTISPNYFQEITRSPCPLYNCTMMCNLQPRGSWMPCNSPTTYSAITLPDVREQHTLSIKATDNATNTGPTLTYTWITDRVPPSMSWVGTPNIATRLENATFVWTTTEPASEPPSFQCRLDRGTWFPCTPKPDGDGQYTWDLYDLTHQDHTFDVLGTDLFGNTAPILSYTWTVDLVNPIVTYPVQWATQGVLFGNNLVLQNNSHSRITFVDFAFSTEIGGRVECQFDGVAYIPCQSLTGQSYVGLTNGQHTFRVRARDHVGRTTPLQEQPYWVWITDTVPPVSRFTEVPNRYTNKLSAQVSATANEVVTSFQCEYRSSQFQQGTSSWILCVDPPFLGTFWNNSITIVLKQSAVSQGGTQIDFPGTHVVNVRSVDLAGNTGAASSYTWDVDLVAPKLIIPAAQSLQPQVFSSTFRWSSTPDATFTWTTNENLVNYTCYIWPAGGWTNPRVCKSGVSYNNLSKAGNMTFEVRALDAAGNYDPKVSRASFNWTNDPYKPVTNVTDGPKYYINRLTDLLFMMTVSAPRVRFECTANRWYDNRTLWQQGMWIPCVDRQATYGFPAFVAYNLADLDNDIFNNTLNAKNPDGIYTFGARAIDVFNRTSTTSWYEFVIDTVPPNTAMEGTIEKATNSSALKFSYFTTKPAYIHSYFLCRLLRQNNRTLQFTECSNNTYRCDWTECGRGNTWFVNSVSGFSMPGVYRFEIRAVDKAGNLDGSPVSSQFTFLPNAPYVKIVDAEPQIGTAASIFDNLTYAFAGDEGLTFTCTFMREDVPGTVMKKDCTSPVTYLAPANPQNYSNSVFTVTATDEAGNMNFETYSRYLFNITSLSQRRALADGRSLPSECTNNDTLFAYIAVGLWVLFIVTIIAFPCAILRKMESKAPSKLQRRDSRQPLTSMGNPTFRQTADDF